MVCVRQCLMTESYYLPLEMVLFAFGYATCIKSSRRDVREREEVEDKGARLNNDTFSLWTSSVAGRPIRACEPSRRPRRRARAEKTPLGRRIPIFSRQHTAHAPTTKWSRVPMPQTGALSPFMMGAHSMPWTLQHHPLAALGFVRTSLRW